MDCSQPGSPGPWGSAAVPARPSQGGPWTTPPVQLLGQPPPAVAPIAAFLEDWGDGCHAPGVRCVGAHASLCIPVNDLLPGRRTAASTSSGTGSCPGSMCLGKGTAPFVWTAY